VTKYDERIKNMQGEWWRIIIATAKLIKAQVHESAYKIDSYPTVMDMKSGENARNWIPPLLFLCLSNIVASKMKTVSLGHALIQAMRPNSALAPVRFALGVSLYHKLGSKWLLNLLSRMGLSISNDDVVRFKLSFVQTGSDDRPDAYPTAFMQFSTNNVDHNMNTIDGLNTFHGTGMIPVTVRYGDSQGIWVT
jgi:hypothetical protein